ncbi:carbon-nitrogen hydrolase family protein [Aestuariibius sp. 2305UL40-4]|uniref:carbon-nitrogen hydrolase family protein n=1 Tax=Aestuariibius violaceus TaxID=3234132 RepID=UPI00345EAF91
MKVGLVQLTSGDDPEANLVQLKPLLSEAMERGAVLITTPEVTNCLSQSRTRQNEVLRPEDADSHLAYGREFAVANGVFLNLGSLALKTDDAAGRFTNRSFLIDPRGEIVARYDKIHMFDVVISKNEKYAESSGYRPGNAAVIAKAEEAKVGLTICYDLRFPYLYRALAQAGADIILVPSAFSPTTGAAHWEPLLRARAIETGAFVVAAAQTGTHPATEGRARKTYGHSLVVSPWGEVLANAGIETGVTVVDLDLSQVADARRRVPAWQHDRYFSAP